MSIKPALTAEEWAKATADYDSLYEPFTGLSVQAYNDGSLGVWGSYEGGAQPPAARHALAALALHGQPWGFTREDAAHLRALADAIDRAATAQELFILLQASDPEPLRDLADRIEALLPPREP